jgi:hypothetical protein
MNFRTPFYRGRPSSRALVLMSPCGEIGRRSGLKRQQVFFGNPLFSNTFKNILATLDGFHLRPMRAYMDR